MLQTLEEITIKRSNLSKLNSNFYDKFKWDIIFFEFQIVHMYNGISYFNPLMLTAAKTGLTILIIKF